MAAVLAVVLSGVFLVASARVLILGGGVAGIIAAQTLHEQGISDFLIIEARDELGGRMQTHNFSGTIIEKGPNWVQGTQTDDGPANPIFVLAEKYNISAPLSDYDSMTTYDASGAVDYESALDKADDNLDTLLETAGTRFNSNQVDASARTGYQFGGAKRQNKYAQVAEYWDYDFEYAQKPDQSSWIASALNNNFTYEVEQGGFSEDNLFSVDQRGFKHLIQAEARTFLKTSQLMLNSTVTKVTYSASDVTVELSNGQNITGDFAICTFSLGVLQNDDVDFEPPLPLWKQEAINSLVMATYTKIFLTFPSKFWFDSQFALYADAERGRYPVWQSLDVDGFLPGSGILFVTVTGDYSLRVESLPDQQVQSETMTVLRSMFPNITVPEPTDFYFPRWHADPLFRGSYSNWPPSFVPEHMLNLQANVDRLWFAGEATSFKYFGFLQGAYDEGKRVGKQLGDCIRRNECKIDHHFVEVRNLRSYRDAFKE